MKERPILFSGSMVRAILAGQKTQTRRIVDAKQHKGLVTLGGSLFDPTRHAAIMLQRCPYGAPGDRLWVRETWRSWEETCDTRGADEDDHRCGPHCRQTYVAYAATPREGFRPVPDRARITYLDESTPLDRNPKLLGPWNPSIHIPRAFSRITLDVTAVRVERLQDITDDDIAAEGVDARAVADLLHPKNQGGPHLVDMIAPKPVDRWRLGWDAINGKRAAWASNPWVWVVSFERAEVASV